MTSKALKLTDIDHGAEELGRFLDAVWGPDWMPQGNGWDWSDEEFVLWERTISIAPDTGVRVE